MQHLRQITTETVINFLHVLGGDWLGGWQSQIAQHILSHPLTIIQAPRQTGKTHIVALIAVIVVTMGGKVIIGMPTLKQAKSIIFRRIAEMLSRLNRLLPELGLRPTGSDTKDEKIYANGGELRALSADKEAQKEGYTGDLLIIDEGHRSEPEILGVFLPFVTLSLKANVGRVIILGVGGHTASLIESQKKGVGDNTFKPLRVTPDEVIADDREYEAVFQLFKSRMTDIEYRQHILCEPVSEGLHRIFNEVRLAHVWTPEELKQWRDTLYFGIDVGRTSDQTAVAVVRSRGGYREWIDTYKTAGAFTNREGNGQDIRVFTFIDSYYYEPQNIAIEINGLGYGLWDVLRKDKFYGLKGINLTYEMKHGLINQISRDARDGIFRVTTQEQKELLEQLQFEVKPNGKYEYDHSDELSALLMAYASAQRVMAIG